YHVSWRLLDKDEKARGRLVSGMLELLRRNGFSDYSHARISYFFRDRTLEGKNIAEVAQWLGDRLPKWEIAPPSRVSRRRRTSVNLSDPVSSDGTD
ncbi:MAG: hypothetical protein NTW03_05105, partial [Verrucomicrobia bacterium]|nr:hypothetical protein [Verrucomicrobiota bacterium]